MIRALFPIALLAACSPEASHIPNPLLLPGQAVGAAIENAAYDRRRAKVAQHVGAHHAQMMAEIDQGGGPRLDEAMALARVPAEARPALWARLAQDRALVARDPEALVVTLMVHGR